MLYKIKAKIDKMKMKSFYTALNDGSIADQEPDGTEIIHAMQKAVKTGDDTLEWYETCYCATPLKHERETVYDTYLDEIETTLVQEVKDDLNGDSFRNYLEERYFENSHSSCDR